VFFLLKKKNKKKKKTNVLFKIFIVRIFPHLGDWNNRDGGGGAHSGLVVIFVPMFLHALMQLGKDFTF